MFLIFFFGGGSPFQNPPPRTPGLKTYSEKRGGKRGENRSFPIEFGRVDRRGSLYLAGAGKEPLEMLRGSVVGAAPRVRCTRREGGR